MRASRGVVGFIVSMFLRPARELFRPARPGVGASAKKFALQAQNGRKTLFSGVLGEFFCGNAVGRGVLGEFCTAHAVRRGLPGEFDTGSGTARSLVASVASPQHRPCLQLPASRHPRAPQPGPPALPTPSTPVGLGRCCLVRPVVSKPGQALPPPTGRSLINFACNSPVACSNIEFASLELQRFLGLLKFGPIELHAKFVWRWPCEPALALPTGRSPHRGRVLRLLGCLPLHAGGAWCAVVLARSISASRSVQNSPCWASWWRERYKTLPACRKSAKLGHFGRARRVLYRTCGEGRCAGRVLYRSGKVWLLLGE